MGQADSKSMHSVLFIHIYMNICIIYLKLVLYDTWHIQYQIPQDLHSSTISMDGFHFYQKNILIWCLYNAQKNKNKLQDY